MVWKDYPKWTKIVSILDLVLMSLSILVAFYSYDSRNNGILGYRFIEGVTKLNYFFIILVLTTTVFGWLIHKIYQRSRSTLFNGGVTAILAILCTFLITLSLDMIFPSSGTPGFSASGLLLIPAAIILYQGGLGKFLIPLLEIDAFGIHDLGYKIIIGLISFIIYLLIGILMGWIYGKIKNVK